MVIEIYPKNIIIRETDINYRVIQLAKEQGIIVNHFKNETSSTYIFQADYEKLYKFLYHLTNEASDYGTIKLY